MDGVSSSRTDISIVGRRSSWESDKVCHVGWNHFLGIWVDEAGFIYEFSLNKDGKSATLTRSVPADLLANYSPPRAERQRWTDLARLNAKGLVWGSLEECLMRAEMSETIFGRVLRWFLAPSPETWLTSVALSAATKSTKLSAVLSDLSPNAVPIMIWMRPSPRHRGEVSRLTPLSPPPVSPPPPPPPQLAVFLEHRKQAMLAAFRRSHHLQRMMNRGATTKAESTRPKAERRDTSWRAESPRI